MNLYLQRQLLYLCATVILISTSAGFALNAQDDLGMPPDLLLEAPPVLEESGETVIADQENDNEPDVPRIEMTFKNADITQVLELFSHVFKKVVVPHASLDGTVTILAPFPMTENEAFQVLNSVLRVRGFTIVGAIQDRLIKILPIAESRQEPSTVRNGSDVPIVKSDQLITQIISLKNVSAADLRGELEPLLSTENALISANTTANFLIVIDTASNIDRIMSIVKLMDVNVTDSMKMFIVPLKSAVAEELASVLSQVFSLGTPQSQSQPAARGRGRTQNQQRRSTAGNSNPYLPRIIPEPRTNSLILLVPEGRYGEIRKMISELDTESAPTLQVVTIQLKYADAVEMERTLSETFEGGQTGRSGQQRGGGSSSGGRSFFEMFSRRGRSGQSGNSNRTGQGSNSRGGTTEGVTRASTETPTTISAEPRTNSLVIAAPREKMELIAEIIAQLDVSSVPRLKYEIIPLAYASAPALAELLKTLFQEGLGMTVGQTSGQSSRQSGRGGRGFGGFGSRGQTSGSGSGRITSGPTRSVAELEAQIAIGSDDRANALVIFGTDENLELVKKVVADLDQDFAPPVTTQIFPLEHADATQLTDEVNRLFEQSDGQQQGSSGGFGGFFGGGRFGRSGSRNAQQTDETRLLGLHQNMVVADIRTNSLIVTATESNMREFEKLIKSLDQPSDLTALVRVYKVQNADAQELADTINNILQTQAQPTGFSFFGQSQSGNRQQMGRLQDLADVGVTAEPSSNSLIITAPPHMFQLVENMLESLDVVQPQVYIEVIIVDVKLTDENRLGIEWDILQRNLVGEGGAGNIAASFGLDPQTSTGLQYSVLSQNFQSFLNALSRDDNVKVLATPHILARDNVEASITLGEDFPLVSSFFPGGQGQAPQITTEMQEIAIKLTVTPHINSAGSILMDVEQTINDRGGLVQQAGFEQPIIIKREASTSVRVANGQTVVIGGIVKERDAVTVNAVPFFSKIPLLGKLFRSKTKTKERSELMVFLTPHIVHSDEEMRLITEKKRAELKHAPDLPGLKISQAATSLPTESVLEDQALPQPGEDGVEAESHPETQTKKHGNGMGRDRKKNIDEKLSGG